MPTLDSAKRRARHALVESMRACVANDRIPLLVKVAFVISCGWLLKALGDEPDEPPVESEYGTKFVAGRDSTVMTPWLRFRGAFEPVLSEFILRHVQQGDFCVDAGANIGYFTVLLAERVAPSGKVLAIEAAPGIARRLRANVELNGAANVVDVVEAACAPHKGETTFYLHPRRDGMSRLRPPAKGIHRRVMGTWKSVTVTADTLTSIVGADAQRVSFIKVDIEGAEKAIAPQIVAGFPHPRLVVALEVWAPIEATLKPFQEEGFYVYDLHNDYHWIFERKVRAITEVTYRDLYRRRVADVLLSRQPLALS
ncbi:FkbM family methyltransferase [Mycobacterium sp. SP-6446]|uniref:FkbM family methyltransferase n=1 Tax=Mycobacterium sp. SP-6446 TaxID=1834162 RepID=UPI00111564AF|nr:FkbM family methyltransferase [Mycobacterium sp. SP-6446]